MKKEAIENQIKTDGQKVIDELSFYEWGVIPY